MSISEAATRSNRSLPSPRVVVFTSQKYSEVMWSRCEGSRVPVEFIAAGGMARGETSRRLEKLKPHIAACLNVSLPVDFRGRYPLGLIEVWAGLARREGGGGHSQSVALVGVARWREKDRHESTLIAQAWAPIYRADTAKRVSARADELAMRLLESSVQRALAEDQYPPSPLRNPTGYRPLTLFQRLGWRIGQMSRRAAVSLGSPVYLLKSAGAILALSFVRPVRDLIRTLRQKHPVRVFTFHRVSELCRDDVTVSPEVFRRQLQYVRRHHVIVDVERGLDLLRNPAPLRKPIAIVTFDDAYRSVYEFAAPIMAELQIPGCCFATTDFVGTDRRYPWDSDSPVRDYLAVMSWEEIRELQHHGWTIGGHTATHPRLADCDRDRVREELESSLVALQRSLGLRDVPMAYPFGGPYDVTEEVLGLVGGSGFSACFSNFGGENLPPVPLCRLRRIDIGGDHRLLAWKARVHSLDRRDWERSWKRAEG